MIRKTLDNPKLPLSIGYFALGLGWFALAIAQYAQIN